MFHTGDPGLRALEQRNLRARAQAFAALFGWAGNFRWLGRGAAWGRRAHDASGGPGSRGERRGERRAG